MTFKIPWIFLFFRNVFNAFLQDISVPVKFLSVIKELEDERDAVIITDKRTRLSTTEVIQKNMTDLFDALSSENTKLPVF